jgi:hypothetical protein
MNNSNRGGYQAEAAVPLAQMGQPVSPPEPGRSQVRGRQFPVGLHTPLRGIATQIYAALCYDVENTGWPGIEEACDRAEDLVNEFLKRGWL